MRVIKIAAIFLSLLFTNLACCEENEEVSVFWTCKCVDGYSYDNWEGKCTNTSKPHIRSVSKNGSDIDITLNTTATSADTSKIIIKVGSLSGSTITYTLGSLASATVTLSGFSPSLASGTTYYIIFDTGAFTGTQGSSAHGIFTLYW